MPRFICSFCKESFDNPDEAFDHLVDRHGDKLEAEYIMEVDD